MDKIRIGKDIKIFWELSATDESVILTQDDLTLEMTTPTGCVAILPFTFDEEEGTLTAYFYGIDHKKLGRYWLTVWYKQDEIGQSALDKVLAFQLVRSTEEETHNDDSIAYAQVNLSGSIEIYGGGTGTGSTYTKEEIDEMISTIDSSIVNVSTSLSNHVTNTAIHVTAADKTRWDAKQDSGDYVTSSQLTAHTSNTAIHVTLEDKVKWDGKQDLITMDSSLSSTSLNPVTNKAITTVIEENELVWSQALNRLNSSIIDVSTNLSNHASNSSIHVTSADKTRWDAKQDSGNYARVDTTNTFTNPQLINAPIGNNSRVWKNVYQPFFTKRIHTAVIYTSIPYDGKMPYLRFTGNPYKNGLIVDFGLTWYGYNGNFINYGCCNNGTFLPPNIYLFTYTKNNIKYVAIGLYTGGEYAKSWYYMSFNIDIYSIQQQLLSTTVIGWTNSYIEQSDTTTKLIPDVGTDDCVLVPQKPILSNIDGDSTSVNGYSITNVTSLPANPDANTIYLITDN